MDRNAWWGGFAVFMIVVTLVGLAAFTINRESVVNIEKERTKREQVRSCRFLEDEVTRSRCIREVAGA